MSDVTMELAMETNDKTMEIARLKAENAKLQDELKFANDQCERAILELLDQQGQLEADNAKLRELCSDLFKGFECGWPSDVCGDCKRDGIGMPIGGCKLEKRARELGVEVNDG